MSMDIWSDEDLDRLERRVDYALHTEDDGRALIVAPQAIKELIIAFRRLRAEASDPTNDAGAPQGRAAREARVVSRSEGADRRPA